MVKKAGVKTATVIKSTQGKYDDYLAQTMAIGIMEQERLRLQKGLIPLSCYISKAGKWEHMTFPEDKKVIDLNFGDSSESADQSKYHVQLKFMGSFWFITNTRPEQDVFINGFKKTNDMLLPYSTTLIEAANTSIIICNRKPQSYNNTNTEIIRKGAPKTGEFGISSFLGDCCHSDFKSIFIGSHPICDLPIKDSADFSAVIAMHLGTPYLVSFGSKNITIDGEPVSQPMTPLEAGSMVKIGAYDFQINLPGDKEFYPPDSEMNERLSFVEINNNGITNNKILLPFQDVISVGRSNNAELPIINNSISTIHAEVIVFIDHLLVIDKGSTNGTFVNNERISKERAFTGDIVSFGNKNYLVSYYD